MIGAVCRLVPVAMAVYAMSEGRHKIAEVGEEALDLVLEFKAAMELQGMATLLRLDLTNSEQLPSDFSRYLRENMDSETDPAFDPWETPYECQRRRDRSIWVVSCGPDQTCGTDDDVELLVREPPGQKRTRWQRR